MRTIKLKMVVAASSVVLWTAQTASAFYDPSTGRWLSRDPVGEPGFQVVQRAVAVTQPGNPVPQSSGRWISRDPIGGNDLEFPQHKQPNTRSDGANLYCFVQNAPINYYDPVGLSVADAANMYSAFVDELKQLCACHLSCPELGWRQNIGAYWGCTRQTENLEDVFDKLKYEDMWDITVNYDTSRWPLNHNSVRMKPRNPEDPVVDADTWKGCFSVTWPQGSSQKDFKRCFTCKELLK